VRWVFEARVLTVLKIREAEELSLVELDKQLNQVISSLSQAARRLACRMMNDALLAERMATVNRKFSNNHALPLTLPQPMVLNYGLQIHLLVVDKPKIIRTEHAK